MTRLNPNKLNVELRCGVTMTEPVIERKYTLTHSDITEELFLTIGLQFSYDKISTMRDEVLAEWRISNGHPFLYAYVYVDGELKSDVPAIRNDVFRRQLPLALEAIRYGDNRLFIAHPDLDNSQIWICFDSINPKYNQFQYWGTFKDYK